MLSCELIPKLRTSQKTEETNLMFRIKLPQRKRCYPLLFPINTGGFSTWSNTNCSPTRKYYYGTEGYYLQVSLRRPQGKGLLIRHGEGRLKSKMRFLLIL